MRKPIVAIVILTAVAAAGTIPALAAAPEERGEAGPQAVRASTVRGVAEVKGAQEQQIFGIGLVVGLRGTGDKGRETQKRIAQIMIASGFNPATAELATKNAALVIVTARISPFKQQQTKFDVTVSAMGDASSLQGGELLAVPLHADNPDAAIYARAQGAVVVGGLEGAGSPTSGMVVNGAILEREIPCKAIQHEAGASGQEAGYLELALNHEDVALARSVAEGINTAQRAPSDKPLARTVNPALIRVDIPDTYKDKPWEFVDDIMNVPVVAEPPATVVINERTGVVVITGTVRVSPVTVTVGSTRIEVTKEGLLSDIERSARRGFYTNAEMIAIIKELSRARALQARLISN